ncbi:PREDICTED: sphingosine kinase 2-like [Acropora digitifera]|uniref:sphingosine kinase 2-like n=1 Tax=Acropora digitifera TaxID=70779 RepID=UPI00077B016D|nr:PREDICTED: sphingosine kinase 2-like [Acropora digitifera]
MTMNPLTEILSGHFKVLSTKKLHFVSLTRDSLTYVKEGSDGRYPCSRRDRSSILVADIYGAKAYRGPEDDSSSYFQLYYCRVFEKKRDKRKICFEVSMSDSDEENASLAEKWVRTILWLVNDPEKEIESIQAERNLPPCRKLLILINPFSGSGRSVRTFREKVEPMLCEADIQYKQITTEYSGHAAEMMQSLNLLDFDGIVICSGDGLVYENRKENCYHESRSRSKVMVTCDNGIIGRQPHDLTSSIFAVIRGKLLDLDICSVVTPTEKLFAFLSVTWGLVSDVDIESEKFRFLGETRFLLGAIIRVIGLRLYRGRLSYLPVNNTSDVESFAMNVRSSHIESTNNSLYHTTVGTAENYERHEVNGVAASSEDSTAVLSSHRRGPIDHLLPPLSAKLPSNWVVEEGEFVFGCPLFLSHIGTDLLMHPDGKFGDGVIGILIVRSGTGRATLMDVFSKMKDGSHVLNNHVKYVKASAFRLEPDTSQAGIIAVDGEKIDYVPIQGQIHKALAKLMCAPPPEN